MGTWSRCKLIIPFDAQVNQVNSLILKCMFIFFAIIQTENWTQSNVNSYDIFLIKVESRACDLNLAYSLLVGM